MRILSIDLGIKSVGLAISGVLEIPQPLSSIDREDIFESLKNIIDEYSIELIVVGFPLTLKGEVGKIAKNARAFALQIEKRFKIKTELIDERFTTKEARKIMRKEGIKKDDDRISAMLILERYLESSRTSHLAQKKSLRNLQKWCIYIL